MTLSPLPILMIEAPVRAALLEDLGRAGDLTTDAIVPATLRAETALVARQAGIVAGLDAASLAFRLVDPAIQVRIEAGDDAGLARHQGRLGAERGGHDGIGGEVAGAAEVLQQGGAHRRFDHQGGQG